MSSPTNPNDLGVVLFAAFDPTVAPGTNDRVGTALTAQTLDNTKWQVGSFNGRAAAGELLTFRVAGLVFAGGSVKIRLQALRADPQNPTLWSPTFIPSVRSDTALTAIEHTILAADLLAITGLADIATFPSADVLLMTTDGQTNQKVRPIIQWQQAPHALDVITVAGWSILPQDRG